MLACKFKILQFLVGWNLCFLKWISWKIIFWWNDHETSCMKTLFALLEQSWKQIWLRNFLLNLKLHSEFKCTGLFLIAFKIWSKKIKMYLIRFSFRLPMRPTLQMAAWALHELREAILSASLKKATFLWKKHFFLLKNKRNI